MPWDDKTRELLIQPAYRTIGRVFGRAAFGAWVALWMWYFLYDEMVYWGLSRFIPVTVTRLPSL